jgi:hypothetical protein
MRNFYEKALFVKADLAATVFECNGFRPSRYASIRCEYRLSSTLSRSRSTKLDLWAGSL